MMDDLYVNDVQICADGSGVSILSWVYCALWAYVSCHVYLCAKTQKGSQKLQAQQRSLFDSGEMALISLSHSRASRLWVWLYTSVKLGGTLVYRYLS